jgi:hypothetical protein
MSNSALPLATHAGAYPDASAIAIKGARIFVSENPA